MPNLSFIDLFEDAEEAIDQPAPPTLPEMQAAIDQQLATDRGAASQPEPANALEALEALASIEPPQEQPNPPREIKTDFLANSLCMSVELNKFGLTKKLKEGDFSVDADKACVTASKRILDSKEYQAITGIDGQIRARFYTLTVPCAILKGGTGFVPLALVEKAEKEMEEFAAKRKALVDAFIAVYPSLVDSARETLRGVWNPADYPSAQYVAKKFSFSWKYLTFGLPSEGSISRELYEKEKKRAFNEANEAATVIQEALRVSFADLVGRMSQSLGVTDEGKKKVFKESTVSKMNEFLETFSARNLTGDQDLEELVNQARGVLRGVDPKALRTNDEIRQQVQETMSKIAESVQGMVTVEAGPKSRKIVLDDEAEA